MTFFALKDGERVFSFEIPIDDEPVHLPDLAKLGLTAFQSNHPDVSLRSHDVLFGFEHD